MKYKMIITLLAISLSFTISFPALEVYSAGLNDSYNKLLESEIASDTDNAEKNDVNKVKQTKEEKNNDSEKTEDELTININENEQVSLGTFKLTAYCSCEKCCGKYAKNRPVDEYGNPIVYGSSGNVLEAGVSIAVDTKMIPYETKVVINGHEYIAHDTGGAIKGNKIDIYFDNHQAALDFGVQYEEVFVIKD